MLAYCKQNINVSFQILRPINFVHVVHQIGGVLYEPPTTKHRGSSSSTVAMTTSLRLQPREPEGSAQKSCDWETCGFHIPDRIGS